MEYINNQGRLEIEGGQLLSRNFAGLEKKVNGRVFNDEGKRNFCVFIDDDAMAQRLIAENWNIKISKPRDEEEPPRYYLPVAVNYDSKWPPRIYLVSHGRLSDEMLDEEDVMILDYPTEIEAADLIINPSRWIDDYGETRVKAYLQEGYFTIHRSRFAEKYAAEEHPEE